MAFPSPPASSPSLAALWPQGLCSNCPLWYPRDLRVARSHHSGLCEMLSSLRPTSLATQWPPRLPPAPTGHHWTHHRFTHCLPSLRCPPTSQCENATEAGLSLPELLTLTPSLQSSAGVGEGESRREME